MRQFDKHKLIYLGLVLSHLLVALPFLHIWFLPDDFVSIYGGMQNPLKILFSRETYALFNRWFFTPLLPISFKLDGYLFKLNPLGYHIHNYLIVVINAIAIYKIARFYLPGLYALLSSVFFLFSIPAFINIGALSWRHYSWGCFFTLFCFYLYKNFEKTNFKKFLLFSIICYFIAILFKSVFAPLPLAIFLLSEIKPCKRLKIFAIYICVFLLYLIWRIYILGGLGGYFFIPSFTISDAILTILFKIPYIVSKTIWGIPFFIYFIALSLCLIRPRLGIVILFLSLISTSPFIFTTIDSSYTFAGRFILVCAIISIAISSFIYHITIKLTKSFKNYIICLICILILSLQIINLPRAFSELSMQAKFVKDSCQRLSNQKSKMVYDRYVWIYNYFYLVKGWFLKKELNLVGIGTLTRDNLALDIYLYQKYVGLPSQEETIFIPSQSKILEYKQLKKILEVIGQKQILKKPNIKLDTTAHILKVQIIDKRTNGVFKVYFLSRLGKQNILFYGMAIPKKSFCCPLRKGEQILFLFISPAGEFSEPLIFKGSSRTKTTKFLSKPQNSAWRVILAPWLVLLARPASRPASLQACKPICDGRGENVQIVRNVRIVRIVKTLSTQ